MLPTVNIYNHGDQLALKLSAFSAAVVKIIKGIPTARWHPASGAWLVDVAHAEAMRTAMAGIPHKIADGVAKSIRQNIDLALVPLDMGPLTEDEAVSWDELQYNPKTKSYDHQMRATILAVRRMRFAFLMEMGTGKTKACIDTLSVLIQKERIHGAIIVAPKAVLFNWEREIEQHSPLPIDARRCVVVTGDKASQLELAYNARINFVITNYETVAKHESLLLQLLVDRPLAIVLDESTRVKNHAALSTKGLLRLRHSARARYILTGTPITQGPLDAFSQFLFLDENILGHHNYFSFKAEYAITGGFRGREVVGYKNLDRLQKKIAPWSYRVLKRDCLDIPEKVYRTVELAMSPTQANLYEQMRKESILEHEGMILSAPVVLTKLLRLQQITSGFLPIIDEFGKSQGYKNLNGPKIDAVKELVEEAHANGQKVIIWCRFTEELLAIMLAFPAGSVAYHGATSAVDRQAAVDSFQSAPGVNLFVGQIQTGGMGITLTAATCVIYVSNSFTLSDRLQSEDRAHRIGQRNVVTYIDVVMRNSVDGFVLKTLKDKKNVADVITGDSLRQLLT